MPISFQSMKNILLNSTHIFSAVNLFLQLCHMGGVNVRGEVKIEMAAVLFPPQVSGNPCQVLQSQVFPGSSSSCQEGLWWSEQKRPTVTVHKTVSLLGQ